MTDHQACDDFLIFDLQLGDRVSVAASCPKGRVIALTGPSGSGKTSLIRTLAGLEPQSSGTMFLDGQMLADSGANFSLPAHKRPISMAFQAAHLIPTLDIGKNLDFAQHRSRNPFGADIRRDIIDACDIGALLGKRPNQLSGGEAKRAALAQALLANGSLLLLDEPFTGIDQSRVQRIRTWLREFVLQHGITAIIATHSIGDILNLCDDALHIDGGTLSAFGPVEEVMTQKPQSYHPTNGQDTQTRPYLGAACSILPARITGAIDKWHMLPLSVCGQAFSIPAPNRLPNKSPLLLKLDARDVSVSRERVKKISIQNQLLVTIEALVDDNNQAFAMVQAKLDCPENSGGYIVHARLTKRSCADLKLAVGDNVFLLIKAASLHHEEVR